MTTSLTFKTAVVALAATTFAFAAPAGAHDNGYAHQHENSNSGNQLLGAVIGGVAGAALGDGIAPRGQSTEFGIAGALIGGTLGAAVVGDGNSNRSHNQGYYNPQTGYYNGGYTQGGYYQQRPAYTYQNQGYRTYGHAPQPYYSTSYPNRTYTTTTVHYGSPYYRRPAYRPYYRAPRTGISINIGSGGYYHNHRGYRNRSYNRRVRHHRRHGH